MRFTVAPAGLGGVLKCVPLRRLKRSAALRELRSPSGHQSLGHGPQGGLLAQPTAAAICWVTALKTKGFGMNVAFAGIRSSSA